MKGFQVFEPSEGKAPEIGAYCQILATSGMETYGWYTGQGFKLDPQGDDMLPPEHVVCYRLTPHGKNDKEPMA
jgi:hypothetical protein